MCHSAPGRSSKARGHSGPVRIKYKVVGAKTLWLDTAYIGSFKTDRAPQRSICSMWLLAYIVESQSDQLRVSLSWQQDQTVAFDAQVLRSMILASYLKLSYLTYL